MKKSGRISLKESKNCQYLLKMTPAEKESLAAMAKSANTTRAEIIRHALNDYYLNYFIDKNDQAFNWTPTSVALPEKDGLYLVTFAGDTTDLDVLMYYRSEGDYPFWDYRGEQFSYAYERDEIAAWAYLPEPYKEVIDA